MNATHWDHFLLWAPPQTTRDNQMNLRLWRALDRVADPDATIAVAWAGVFPYYSGHHCCDMLGKCDHHIARLPARRGIRRAGHNKFDLEYTLSVQRPDVVLHAFTPLLRQSYRPVRVTIDGEAVAFYVRRSTPYVHGGRRVTHAAACEIIPSMRHAPAESDSGRRP